MKFELKPILSVMKEFYLRPISNERFQDYLFLLQGDSKDDLALPISGFNPMAKDHIIEKIKELEMLGAEEIMRRTIDAFNSKYLFSENPKITVVLNIADDLMGAWTNYFTTDYDSKFKIDALLKRNFCVPYFWTSEIFSEKLIKIRTLDYLSRTVYRMNKIKLKTLEEYFEQELHVAKSRNEYTASFTTMDNKQLESFYSVNKNTMEYDKIFNFFYGDKASESLAYKLYGIRGQTGFDYANYLSRKMN